MPETAISRAEAEIIAGLDPGIRPAVVMLREHGVDTRGSCQGGSGHAYTHPVITFGGDGHAGLRAVWLLEGAGWQVNELVRIWDLSAGSFPHWRIDLESCQRRNDWPVLDDSERFQIDEARDVLSRWDAEGANLPTHLARPGRELALSGTLRNLLGLLDKIAPKGESDA
jgi:hypothetical protein